MKRALLSFTILSAALLPGCDHYSEKLASLESELGAPSIYAQDAGTLNNVATAAGGTAAAMPYDRALAQAYYARAIEENERMDYRAAQYFTGKAYDVLHGQSTGPASPKDFGMDASMSAEHQELADARAQLIAALQAPKTPQNQRALIDAQVNYDGWVDQVGENKQGAALTCRDSFENALARLQDPYGEAARYTVTFMPGQPILSEAGQNVIGDVATLVRDNPTKRYKIVLSQSTADNSAYYQSIYNALTLQGVQGEGIFTKSASTQQPAGVQPVGYTPATNQAVELVVKFAPEEQAGAPVPAGTPILNQ